MKASTSASDSEDSRSVTHLTLQQHDDEEDLDRRRLRRAVGVAVVAHVGLLLVNVPSLYSDRVEAVEKDKKFVYQVDRYVPPPPEPEVKVPPMRATKVPIPDPDPDDPEPLYVEEEVELDFDLDVADLPLAFPEAPPEPEITGPIELGPEVVPPRKISGPQPVYTELARRARISGIVLLQAVIDKSGAVTEIEIGRGLSMGLTDAAVEAVTQWRYEPATLRGKPVAVYMTLQIHFTLQ